MAKWVYMFTEGNATMRNLLGGNEQSTHKYVSELLGKGTIDKKSSGETKGIGLRAVNGYP